MGVENEEGFVDEVGAQHAIEAALEDVWSGLHHDDDDVEEESGDEGENIEEDPEGWKLYDLTDGLLALDLLGEDFERDATANGELMHCSTFLNLLFKCSR
jgi:hypothetical protein